MRRVWLRSAHALRQVSRGALCAVFIIATVEGGADPQAVADKLREAATLAGCPRPVVAMQSLAAGTVEIIVTCKEVPDGG